MRLNRSYGFDDLRSYSGGSGALDQLLVNTPNSEDPNDSYYISLWTDWGSSNFSSPFTAGSVISVSYPGASPLESPFTVDFYDE